MTDRLGTLQETNDGWQLHFVRQLDKPRASVWRAFTEPAQRGKWFPDKMIGDLVPGGALEFASDYGPSFSGKILDIDEPRLLVMLWGTDELRFELRDKGGTTELMLTVSFNEQGKAARDGAGWHECLDNLVKLYDDSFAAESWGTVHPAYVERFGPEAATIGPPAGYEATREES